MGHQVNDEGSAELISDISVFQQIVNIKEVTGMLTVQSCHDFASVDRLRVLESSETVICSQSDSPYGLYICSASQRRTSKARGAMEAQPQLS